jgi:quercetin dioxygenase-like cupin family protein
MITVEKEEYTINAGDFLHFQADRPREYECIEVEMATAIMQICYQH